MDYTRFRTVENPTNRQTYLKARPEKTYISELRNYKYR